MIYIAAHESDSALAARIIGELHAAQIGAQMDTGMDNGMQKRSRADILIPVLSPEAVGDGALERAILAALDNSQHIIPVMAKPIEMPAWINHLNAIDANSPNALAQLRAQIVRLTASDAPLPVRVRTPAARRSNRNIGFVAAAAALIMFGAGIYGVGVLGLQAPEDEYDAVETSVVLTRDVLARPELEQYALLLPRTTDEAANYPATLQRVPTVYRVLMAETATATAAGTFSPSAMPTLSPTMEATPTY